MAPGVREGLLDDSVQSELGRTAHVVSHRVDVGVHVEHAGLPEGSDVGPEGVTEPELLELRGPQAAGHPPNLVRGVDDLLPDLLEERVSCRVVGLEGELAQTQDQRRQALRRVVVQLARDALALLLRGPEGALGEVLEPAHRHDVSDAANDLDFSVRVGPGAEADLDREFAPVPAAAVEVQACPHGPGVRLAHVRRAMPLVPPVQRLGQQRLDGHADELLAGPPEEVLHAPVRNANGAVGPDDDAAVGRGVEDRLEFVGGEQSAILE